MSYTPINWQTGQTITAEKLNKMDNGWSYSSTSTEICDESVTTADDGYGTFAGQLSVSSITADTIVVTYDGNEYTCDRGSDGGYGAPFDEATEQQDWSTYPFAIYDDGYVVTQTSGSHTFVIVAEGTPTIETSKEFRSAVESFVDVNMIPMRCVSDTTTWLEMRKAFDDGKLMFFVPNPNLPSLCIITSFYSSAVEYIPALSGVTASFVNGVFHVEVAI